MQESRMGARTCPFVCVGYEGDGGSFDCGWADVRMTGGLPHTPPSQGSHILHPPVAMETACKPGNKPQICKELWTFRAKHKVVVTLIYRLCNGNMLAGHWAKTTAIFPWWQLIFSGFPTRFPHRKPVCVCATGSNPLAHVRASFSSADSRKNSPFRCLLGGILRELDTESVAFAEIIGVVLDGDAPSAPAGIPTCRHTAFCHRASWYFPELEPPHREFD